MAVREEHDEHNSRLEKYIQQINTKIHSGTKITHTFSLQIVRKQSYETVVPFRIATRFTFAS